MNAKSAAFVNIPSPPSKKSTLLSRCADTLHAVRCDGECLLHIMSTSSTPPFRPLLFRQPWRGRSRESVETTSRHSTRRRCQLHISIEAVSKKRLFLSQCETTGQSSLSNSHILTVLYLYWLLALPESAKYWAKSMEPSHLLRRYPVTRADA